MEQLIAKLSTNPILNCDVLEVLRRGTGRVLYNESDGFLVHDEASRTNYMSGAHMGAAVQMLALIEHGMLFCVREKSYIPEIEKRFPSRFHMTCYQALYDKKQPPKAADVPYEIRKLDINHLPLVEENYAGIDDTDYIKGRIAEGMFGLFDGERPAGFVGKHEEGSIGLLHILPAYRRMGLGYALSAFMVGRALCLGEIPYAQITEGNEASLAMHEKLGFRISREKVYWLD